MTVEALVARWQKDPAAPAVVWNDRTILYSELASEVERQRRSLQNHGVVPGALAALQADFSPTAIAVLFALWLERAIVLLLSHEAAERYDQQHALPACEWNVTVNAGESVAVTRRIDEVCYPLVDRLRTDGLPGLLLRSSGSAGTPKTIVHDVHRLLRKFERPRTGYRTLAFLLFDHIGGLDTLLVTVANGGCLIVPPSRSPDRVAETISRHRVEVLPASPTFLNLLLMSGAHERHDPSSLRIVTYGTEVMPDSILQRVSAAWPHVRLVQKFGMSELGTLRSQSRSSDSPWVRVGGEGVEWRVVDGLLELRSEMAMLGYLDAPSPLAADGWLKTGDAVEVDGEYLRFRGRRSEMINVGGSKVYPVEIETVMLNAPGVLEATVSGESNPLIGTLIKAVVRVAGDDPDEVVRARVRQFCQEHLLPYQVPQRLVVTREPLHSARFKARRQGV